MAYARRRRWDVALAIGAALLIVVLWLINEQPWLPTLRVWTCGSSYESQVDFARYFGKKHHCKVLVTGAPVQWLLELAGKGARTDVIVGRSGPGWLWLKNKGLLAEGPVFFGFDPYVIVIPPGNEGEIKEVKDLDKGVYCVAAPEAMRPKGRCVTSVLEAIGDVLDDPGLAEIFYVAAKRKVKCGRLVFKALRQGDVYVAITQYSQTKLPEADGMGILPIDAKYLLRMKKCRGSMAQTAGALTSSRHLELAKAYVEELASPESRTIIEQRGYYHITNPFCKPFKPLLKIYVPRHPHSYQQQLAEELMADGQWDLAMRRWLKLLHVFGPSPYDAKARYYAGYCAAKLGLRRGAWAMWQRCVKDYPRRGLFEWRGPVFMMGEKNPNPQDMDEKYWADRARQALSEMGSKPGEFGADWETNDVNDMLVDYLPREIRVIDADVTKGSRRNLAVAEDELLCGLYDAALIDYNKVYTLNVPSEDEDYALFRAGECLWLMGNKASAADIWDECKSNYTGQVWAEISGRLVYLIGQEGEPLEDKIVPKNSVKILDDKLDSTPLRTAQARGINNAYWDFRTRNLTGALKECLKVAHGFYKPPGPEEMKNKIPDYRPQARYWAGIMCCWLGQPGAAVWQWRRLIRDYPGSDMAAEARAALKTLQNYQGLTQEQRVEVSQALARPLAEPAPGTAPLDAGLVTFPETLPDRLARQALADLTPDKGAPAIWHHIALELFVCKQYKEALHSFLKVMTVVNTRGAKGNRWKDEALYFAGLCLKHLGKPERARARWQQLLKKHPDSRWASLARRELAPAAPTGKAPAAEVSSRG